MFVKKIVRVAKRVWRKVTGITAETWAAIAAIASAGAAIASVFTAYNANVSTQRFNAFQEKIQMADAGKDYRASMYEYNQLAQLFVFDIAQSVLDVKKGRKEASEADLVDADKVNELYGQLYLSIDAMTIATGHTYEGLRLGIRKIRDAHLNVATLAYEFLVKADAPALITDRVVEELTTEVTGTDDVKDILVRLFNSVGEAELASQLDQFYAQLVKIYNENIPMPEADKE